MPRLIAGTRLAALLWALVLAFAAAPASAAVDITFYSKELGSSFPHAFVTMKGKLDRDGRAIAEDYGFSAKTISPAILMGKVKGEVTSDHNEDYVKGSEKHFTVTLSDTEYDAVMAAVERWRTAKQPSYDLGKANCVHFVGELAAALGMQAAPAKGLMKKPGGFLDSVTVANRDWLLARGGTIHKAKLAEAPRPAT